MAVLSLVWPVTAGQKPTVECQLRSEGFTGGKSSDPTVAASSIQAFVGMGTESTYVITTRVMF